MVAGAVVLLALVESGAGGSAVVKPALVGLVAHKQVSGVVGRRPLPRSVVLVVGVVEYAAAVVEVVAVVAYAVFDAF